VEASITLKNVSKHFKNRYVLSNLNFGVETGSIFAVLGKNGEGKSTFLKLLSGIYAPSSGKFYINGKEFAEHRKELIKEIGYLGEKPIHDKNLTILENLQTRAKYLGMPENTYEKNSRELIARFQLKENLDKPAALCSAGIQKRLEIALSLLHDPAILIWDEPLTNLDFNFRKILINYLLEIKGKKTIIIATNEFTELHTVADRWIVLHNRNIRFDGDLEKMTTNIDIPFLGQLEMKKSAENGIEYLEKESSIINIANRGNSICFQCAGLKEFYHAIKKIDSEDILRISCNSIDLEDLLNQLLSDEGF